MFIAGDIRGARLESDARPAGNGPSAPHRPEASRQRLPTHHSRHSRRENHGVSLDTLLTVADLSLSVNLTFVISLIDYKVHRLNCEEYNTNISELKHMVC